MSFSEQPRNVLEQVAASAAKLFNQNWSELPQHVRDRWVEACRNAEKSAVSGGSGETPMDQAAVDAVKGWLMSQTVRPEVTAELVEVIETPLPEVPPAGGDQSIPPNPENETPPGFGQEIVNPDPESIVSTSETQTITPVPGEEVRQTIPAGLGGEHHPGGVTLGGNADFSVPLTNPAPATDQPADAPVTNPAPATKPATGGKKKKEGGEK